MSTVMRPRRLRSSTFITPASFGFDDFFGEDITTGIDGDGAEVGEPQDQEESVEDDGFVAGRRARVEG